MAVTQEFAYLSSFWKFAEWKEKEVLVALMQRNAFKYFEERRGDLNRFAALE